MDFYLYPAAATPAEGLHLPINPERVDITTGAQTQSFSPVEVGQVSFARGTVPTRVVLKGFLPGEDRASDPWVQDWRPPLDFVFQIQQWMAKGEAIRLLVTESEVTGWLLFLEGRESAIAEGSGWGDVPYTLTLVEQREVRVLTVDEEAAEQAQAAVGVSPLAATPTRPPTAEAGEGDTLWIIAHRYYGDGERWVDLWNSNFDLIGADPTLEVTPGSVLVLP